MISLYIITWLILGGFSITSYSLILEKKCFFQSSTLLCPAVLSVNEKIVSLLIVIVMTSVFALFGWKLWSILKKMDISPKFKKISALIAFLFISAILVVPFGSSDMSYYFAAGRAQNQGLNIYHDHWQMEKEFVYPVPMSDIIGFSYGPIIAHAFSGLYQISNNESVWFMVMWKLLMATSVVLCGYSIYRLISLLDGKVDKKLIYAVFLLQPLLVFETVVNGHFDVLWLICVLEAIIAAHKKKWIWVIPLLVIGIWIKFVPALIAPFFLLWWWQSITKENWKKQLWRTVGGVVLGVVITTLVWHKYWIGPEVFQSVVIQSKWAVMSLFAVIYFSLKPLFESVFGSNAHWILTRGVHVAVFTVFAYVLFPYFKKVFSILRKKMVWETGDYIAGMFVFLLVYLLVWQKSFLPWYGLWFLPLGIVLYSIYQNPYLLRITRWITLSPFIYYLLWLVDWFFTHTDAGSELWFYYAMVGIVFLYPFSIILEWRASGFAIQKEKNLEKKNIVRFLIRQVYKMCIAIPFGFLIELIFLGKKKMIEEVPYEYCVCITSVIYHKQKALSYASTRSVYSPEERYAQTLATIRSIREKIPGARIVCIEAGLEAAPFDLKNQVDEYVYVGDRFLVRRACDSSLKSLGEVSMLLAAGSKLPRARQYWKISGRYVLTHEFNLKEWNREGMVFYYIRPDFVSTRLYSFSNNAKKIWLKSLAKGIPYLLLDYPVEYTLNRFVSKKYISTVESVGVMGNDATNGREIKE